MNRCKTGKVPFDSYELAMRVRGRHCRDDAGRCGIYKCKFCHKWHVGTRLHKTMGRPRIEYMDVNDEGVAS